MMSLTFGLFTQVSGSGPLGPLVLMRSGKRYFALLLVFFRKRFWQELILV